ncbi:hypothetical protein [Gracilibacillus suaedae]|uniref:hypothetical protein n=1 Tax=Gracilibacillus suaedae TaxID=2820273 RepID=UPI001ABE6465|nr:hypothetical protein [Gracilibacillus suaedae]
MKNNRLLWKLVVVLFIIIVGTFIVDQWRTTTYKEVLSDLIPEDEEIRAIDITYINNNEVGRERKDMYLNNNDEIMKIMEHSANMKLKKTTQRGNPIYLMTVRTSKGAYSISIDDKDNLFIEGDRYNYHIISDNELVKAIESYGDKWEIREG